MGQVLQPVLTEVAHRQIREQVAGRLRKQHLPAVGCRHHPSPPVQSDADVALLGEGRLAGVDAHPHSHRRRRQRALCVCGRSDRVRRTPEGAQKGIALRIDLNAIVRGDRFPHQPPVLCKYAFVLRSELLEQARRALDVGEEERDGARRKSSPHVSLIMGHTPVEV